MKQDVHRGDLEGKELRKLELKAEVTSGRRKREGQIEVVQEVR